MAEKSDDFRFEITKHLTLIAEQSNGWTKELNMVSWKGRKPVYDIRSWSPDHKAMAKGITLTEAELAKVKAVL